MSMTSNPQSASNRPISDSSVVENSELAKFEELGATGADNHSLLRRYAFFQTVPAWLVSTLVHVLILLVLGLVTLPDPTQIVSVLTVNPSDDEGPEIEEFVIQEMESGEVSEMEEIADPIADIAESVEMSVPTEIEPIEIATMVIEMSDMASELAPPDTSLQSLESLSVQPLGSRSTDMKEKFLRAYGGTKSSEAAVTKSLKWLSRHQMPNGAWTFQHNMVCRGACGNPGKPEYARALNGATALTLLPFMGAGQTHLQGDFKETVFRGLRFLVTNGKAGKKNGLPVLDFTEGGGNMYSHAIVAITLCEAYAMTEDPELLIPAQAALNFLVVAQCRDGGWRYSLSSAEGDTSVVGWAVMAFKSGYMAHLNVPSRTIAGSLRFLDKVSSKNNSLYGYVEPSKSIRPGCTAIGLLCRMYTGWDKTHPSIVAGVKELSAKGVLKNDIYYNYYAAQVLRHYGGQEWDKFNVELRDWLVDTQSQTSGSRGSWHFADSASHRGPKEGGRLASTCFATMILEVYYRHMPLYAEAAAEEDFPL